MTETELAEHVASRLVAGTRAGLVWNPPYPFNDQPLFLSAADFKGWSRSTPCDSPFEARVDILRADRTSPGLFLAGDRQLRIRIWCRLRNTENRGCVAVDVPLPESGSLRDLAQLLFHTATYSTRDDDFESARRIADQILDIGLPHPAPPPRPEA